MLLDLATWWFSLFSAPICPAAPATAAPLVLAAEPRVAYDGDSMSVRVRDPASGKLRLVADGNATLH